MHPVSLNGGKQPGHSTRATLMHSLNVDEAICSGSRTRPTLIPPVSSLVANTSATLMPTGNEQAYSDSIGLRVIMDVTETDQAVANRQNVDVLTWNDDLHIMMQEVEDGHASDTGSESVNYDHELMGPADSDSEEDKISQMSIDSDIMPELVSLEEWISGDEVYWVESECKSGMSDRNVGG